MNNRFLPKAEYEKNKEKKGVYPIDDKLDDFIQTVEFKQAFLHILLPYAQQYHKIGLPHYEPVLSGFKEICEDNDSMRDFVDQCHETTNNENDRVSKDEFVEMYRLHFKLKQMTWMNVLNDIKRCGLQYNRALRVGNIKGCIVGLKPWDSCIFVDNNINTTSNEIDHGLDAGTEQSLEVVSIEIPETKTEDGVSDDEALDIIKKIILDWD